MTNCESGPKALFYRHRLQTDGSTHSHPDRCLDVFGAPFDHTAAAPLTVVPAALAGFGRRGVLTGTKCPNRASARISDVPGTSQCRLLCYIQPGLSVQQPITTVGPLDGVAVLLYLPADSAVNSECLVYPPPPDCDKKRGNLG